MIIFRHDSAPYNYVTVRDRVVTGDLVGTIRGGQFYVDQSDGWLFPCELDDPQCYARRMQAASPIPLGLHHGGWRA